MQIITAREFRANQKKYFALAETEQVYVQRKGQRPICISVVDEDVLAERVAKAMDVIETSKQRIKDSLKELSSIVNPSANDNWLTPELLAKVEKGKSDAKAGRCVVLETDDDLKNFFDSL